MLRLQQAFVRLSVLLSSWICCATLAAAQIQRAPVPRGTPPPLPAQAGGPPCQANWVPTFGNPFDGDVRGTALFDDGTGPALYACGSFHTASGQTLNGVAKWNGTSWSSLAGGTDGTVQCIAAFDDGSGPALYIGGPFSQAGGVSAPGVARWNGSSWSGLGQALGAILETMLVFDDGSGPALYVGGASYSYGGSPIAKWTGSGWSAVGGGLGSNMQFAPQVLALASFDAGSGPQLIAGGVFATAGGLAVANIASWDGSQWSALGAGASGQVVALAAFDIGAGPRLFAGGTFLSAGGISAAHVAVWDGASWSNLGAGVDYIVHALRGFDDGNSSALYAGGYLQNSFGIFAHIRQWNGAAWTPILSGTGVFEYSLEVHDLSDGPALYAGGFFTAPSGDMNIAKWGNQAGCGAPGAVVCEPGSGAVLACPCGNPPAGLDRGCDNSAATGGASLGATGIARVTYDTVVLTTSDEMPAATSIVLQGDALGSGAVFGQGVRCVGGALKRMYVKTAASGSISTPQPGDPRVTARSAALGDTIAGGTHRFYGVYYRDPNVLGGCSAGSTFNVTQQLDVLWSN